LRLVLSNEKVAPDVFWMNIEGDYHGEMGQFYMLRAWDKYPVLSRPISIHDIGKGYISFLYRKVGEGTELLSALKPGDTLMLEGPFGNGYPYTENKVALIGGGMGTAPLLYAAKRLPNADVYLGFSGKSFRVEAFEQAAGKIVVNIGGYIMNDLEPDAYDAVYCCGSLGMMRALAERMEGSRARLYVSLEKRMACGVGACLGCSIATKHGNRKICSDGPVFAAEEVNFYAGHDL
jgi:dihydroorotate dehydrogenase electron transfer subunit